MLEEGFNTNYMCSSERIFDRSIEMKIPISSLTFAKWVHTLW